jgi:hypothetical protein
MYSVLEPSWAAALATLLAAALALVVLQGFRSLAGAAASQRPRRRAPGASPEDWLLGPALRSQAALGLPGLAIRCGGSAAAVSEWSADEPPPLSADGPSHLWGLLPRRGPFADIVIRPEPVEIAAPVSAVWDAFLDFDRYALWNPFHRKVEIVEEGEGDATTVAVRMTVDMGALLGTLVSTETICYVDSERHILMYSARHPSALRMVWLLPSADGEGTVFHSYDMIGGYPALFSRGHIVGVVHRGFTAQHEALRDYVHKLTAGSAPERGSRQRSSRSPSPKSGR